MPLTFASQPAVEPFFSKWMFGLSSARLVTTMSPVDTTFSGGKVDDEVAARVRRAQ